MVYLGCDSPVPTSKGDWITVENLSEEDAFIRQWFSKKHVYFIGAHTGCSCGFPSVSATEPMDYYDGLFDEEDEEERQKDIRSMSALIDLLRTLTTTNETVEVLPAWYNNLGSAPRGRLRVDVTVLEPGKAFFNQDYIYEMKAEQSGAGYPPQGVGSPDP